MGDISRYANLGTRDFSGPIEFPGLGLFFNPEQHFFGTNIHWYGVIIAIGLVLALLLCMYIARKSGLGDDVILDVVIWATPVSVICARLYYVVFRFENYKDNLWDIFKIWEGGIAIYGAIIGAVLATAVYCRVKKLDTLKVFDVACIGLVLGQAVGRWGNFVNREAFGGPAGDNFLLRMKIYTTQAMTTWAVVHPTFLYESLWNTGVLALLLFFYKRRKFDGQIFWTYIFAYGIGRLWIESLRADSLYIGVFKVSQLVALLTAVAGAVMLVRGFKSYKLGDNT